MNLNEIIEKFALPGVAAEQLRALDMRENVLGDGVSMMSGHDQGVAYRFFPHTVKNEKKSKTLKYAYFDEVDMIEWLVDRRTKPVEIALRRIPDPENPEKVIYKCELPESLLSFDEDGVCIGGSYKAAFERYKEGKGTPGLPLNRWGVLSDSNVATLAANGIFSVEQLGAQPRSKIEGKFPQEIVEAFEQAIVWETSKDARAITAKQSEELVKLHELNAKRESEIEELKAQVKAMAQGSMRKPGQKRELVVGEN